MQGETCGPSRRTEGSDCGWAQRRAPKAYQHIFGAICLRRTCSLAHLPTDMSLYEANCRVLRPKTVIEAPTSLIGVAGARRTACCKLALKSHLNYIRLGVPRNGNWGHRLLLADFPATEGQSPLQAPWHEVTLCASTIRI